MLDHARIVGHGRGIGLNPKNRKFLNVVRRRVVKSMAWSKQKHW